MPGKIDWGREIGRRIKLRDLHVFFTVAELGSMGKAAANLGVSTPTVSDVIADLEHAVGVRLFDRNAHGVEPTLYGRAVLKRGLIAFDELKQCIKDIEFLADPSLGEVRIGCWAGSTHTFLPRLIQNFSDAYPKVVLRVTEIPTAASYSGLRERTHDLHLEWCVPPFYRDETGHNR
jgi:DNA-binding transcriptional LysR family regulator